MFINQAHLSQSLHIHSKKVFPIEIEEIINHLFQTKVNYAQVLLKKESLILDCFDILLKILHIMNLFFLDAWILFLNDCLFHSDYLSPLLSEFSLNHLLMF